MGDNENRDQLSSQWREWRLHHGGGNARETAYEIIKDKIISLDLKPGQHLSDKLLAEELNMSRTPVREALIILSVSNMVVLKPQIGTFVAHIDVDRMEMEQFSRYTMEKQILSMACGKLSDEDKWHYEQNIQAYEHYMQLAPGNEKKLLELDNEFHLIAFTAVGKGDDFFHMMERMQHIERMRMLSIMGVENDSTLDDHSKIYRALAAGDREQAQQVLDLHLNRYKENLEEVRRHFPEYFPD